MKTRVILFLLLAAVAASAAWLLLRDGDTDAPTARILRDGVLLEEIDLDQVDEPRSLVLEDESGSNTVQVERGRIRISAADCPDQVCVKQGWISGGAVPIICLPHRLTIEIVDGGGDLDGAAG
ncbi:MAG: NusG domain II-containing protein [Lawsonibacter sp.]|nr:NusG domain II-containing protein [Lawsonibacter sp.]